MITINIPGFTADASLYSGSTYSIRVAARFATTGEVRPQLRREPEDCIPGCVCVSPIDCPCCDVVGRPRSRPEPGPLVNRFRSLRP